MYRKGISAVEKACADDVTCVAYDYSTKYGYGFPCSSNRIKSAAKSLEYKVCERKGNQY